MDNPEKTATKDEEKNKKTPNTICVGHHKHK
jgi:hypothetical protein